jgi:hypothetical protein
MTSLFGNTRRTDALMKAVDRVNARHGLDTIHIGALRNDRSWTSKRKRISPSYTTSWGALPVVHMSYRHDARTMTDTARRSDAPHTD